MQGPIICASCGTVSAAPRPAMRGSLILEIFLWLFFIFPGVFYSFWRRKGKESCPNCNSENIMPVNSPGGQETLRRFSPPR
jgi:hypothetical protein